MNTNKVPTCVKAGVACAANERASVTGSKRTPSRNRSAGSLPACCAGKNGSPFQHLLAYRGTPPAFNFFVANDGFTSSSLVLFAARATCSFTDFSRSTMDTWIGPDKDFKLTMAGDAHVDESQFKGMSKYFNGSTMKGRANFSI
ncbi:hypothetical protein B566_EDAN004181 [Ephemera danica]|nr:hypothetical protein B566_EDAN004181 [Ephemera danica]